MPRSTSTKKAPSKRSAKHGFDLRTEGAEAVAIAAASLVLNTVPTSVARFMRIHRTCNTSATHTLETFRSVMLHQMKMAA